MNHQNTHEWATKNFGSALLFNKKKVKRLVGVATRLAEAKGTSLARLFDGWYDTKATYHLLKQAVMTPDCIQNPHRKIAYQNIENWKGDVLVIENSSEFEWNHKEPITGLGPVGSGRDCDQGFILHSTLAIGVKYNGSTEVLGLPFQQYYVRPPVREKRKRRGRTEDIIETDLWRNVVKKKGLPALSKVIRVCDRAADIYEVLMENKEYGCSHIIRLKHDRTVLSEAVQIKSLMTNLESMGQTQIEKILKTGLKAENLQLETAHAIFAAISIMSIVGLRILDLRERLRMNSDAPASESGLNELELKILGKYLKRDLKTVKCVALAIGRLGGHQNRKSDGMPGVLSLWWGMSRFLGIMEGIYLATN